MPIRAIFRQLGLGRNTERSIGVVTGEVGAGKTVSVRTVLAGLDTSRHTVIYLGGCDTLKRPHLSA